MSGEFSYKVIQEPSQDEIENLTKDKSTVDGSHQQSLKPVADKIGWSNSCISLNDEIGVALIKIFYKAQDSTVNNLSELQQFREINASNIMKKCNQKIGACDFETRLKSWASS